MASHERHLTRRNGDGDEAIGRKQVVLSALVHGAQVAILAKRKIEVAMRVLFPTRAFDAVTFAELAGLLVARSRLEDAQPV